MSRPSSSWKASRRTRRSRRSSTRPKYPRRDSLHPAGAVAWHGARAVRSRGPVAAVGTRGDAPRGPGPGGGRVARRSPRATGGAASAPSGRPSGGAAGVFRGPSGRSDLSLAERRAPDRAVATARGTPRPAGRRAAAEMDPRPRTGRSTRNRPRHSRAARPPDRGRIRPRLSRAAGPGVAARAQRRREQGITPLRRLGEGRLFESLRDWVPGDDLRHIDWKATGRRGKVITRQYEAERRQHVLLVLDTGRLLTADIAGVSRLDYVVQAALELAYAAAQHDDNVGVMAFADGVQHFVAPQRGRLGLKRVLDVLAVVEPKLVEPDYPGAFRYLAARNRKRALTVLFTDVIDRFASDALVANVASLRPRHLPLAVTLRNPELDALAGLRPTVVRDAFRKAAAEELLHAREEALGHMRRAGVIVLDVPPARAAQAVVARYLELKRRGRL